MHLARRQRLALRRGGEVHRVERALRARRGLGERIDERAQCERDIGDDRIAHRRTRGLVGVARDRDQLGARGEEVAGDVRVVGEDRRARDEHEVVAGERLRRAAPTAGGSMP